MDKPLHDYDKRIIRRSITKGILSEEDASRRIASLADRADNLIPAESEASEEGAPASASAERLDAPEPASVDAAAGDA